MVTDPAFAREAGGFVFFAEGALDQPFRSPYSVVVASESAHVLLLLKRQLDAFLGERVFKDSALRFLRGRFFLG